jgi:hypothetical protein
MTERYQVAVGQIIDLYSGEAALGFVMATNAVAKASEPGGGSREEAFAEISNGTHIVVDERIPASPSHEAAGSNLCGHWGCLRKERGGGRSQVKILR